MNTALLITSVFVIGFSSGFLFCFQFIALPAVRAAQEIRRIVLKGLEDQLSSMRRMATTLGIALPEQVIFEKQKDGTVVSPIQINNKETNK